MQFLSPLGLTLVLFPQFLYMHHNLEGTTELDPQAFDK